MAATTKELIQGDVEKLSQRITSSLSSAFGPWSTTQDHNAAIATITIYGAILLLGLIGHACVVAYSTVSWKRYHSCRRGSLLVISNLSIAQMIFLLCCLPSIAYKTIMSLTFEPWELGDVICRVVPFVEHIILGVTVLSICVLSIDRLRSALRNTKAYEEAGETRVTGICKLIVIWIGAILLATPELFMHGLATQVYKIPQSVFEKITTKDPHILVGVLPQYQRLENLAGSIEDLDVFLKNVGINPAAEDDYFVTDNITFAVNYQFEKCESRVSLWPDAPEFLASFVEIYANLRLWWIFGFYFSFTVILCLLFVIVISLKLSRTHDQCVKEYKQLPVDGAAGTLTSRKDSSLNRRNSAASDQTLSSEAQQLMAAEGRSLFTPNNETSRNNNRPNSNPNGSFSAVNSYPGGVMSPVIVRGCIIPHSPSDAGSCCARSPVTSPSVTSPIYDFIGTNHRKTSSLPPHGRGSRAKSRMQKLTLYNVARDRALNMLLIALILAFSITWLPQIVFHILLANGLIKTTFAFQYVTLIQSTCRYISVFSFAVNPVAFFFGYKPYRAFISQLCCRHCR